MLTLKNNGVVCDFGKGTAYLGKCIEKSKATISITNSKKTCSKGVILMNFPDLESLNKTIKFMELVRNEFMLEQELNKC